MLAESFAWRFQTAFVPCALPIQSVTRNARGRRGKVLATAASIRKRRMPDATRQEPYYCRVCGERVRQKGDSGLFVNVVKGKRILERWALCKEHNPRR